jgi:hypothetical protein
LIKRLVHIALIICSLSISTWGAYSYLPDYLSKKMNRHLKKLFGTEITRQEAFLPDSLNIDHQLFKIIKQDSVIGYSIISRALGCRVGGCDKPSSDSITFEQFYYMTAFDSKKEVRKVRVLEYTSDYGYQISSRGWLKQFEGKSKNIKKEVDGISGATVSVKSITSGINKQITILNQSL